MKLKQLLRSDDSAVSPVIGVILMVAITVILAAVIATFVLGLGEQVSDTTPNANFQVESPDTSYELAANETTESDDDNIAEGEIVRFTHTSGPEIERDALRITGTSQDDIQETVNEELDGVAGYTNDDIDVTLETIPSEDDQDEISASDRISLQLTLEVDDAFDDSGEPDVETVTLLEDEDVTLVWSSQGDSATLRTFTINEIELTVTNLDT